ncbi:MAG: hypothetical protein M1433_02110 [Candidatus Parvarchaeota archaeon]|nr:hypothetical protein [Candidatus Parvarchaeota archaeon]
MISFVYFDVDRVLTFGFDWEMLESDIGIPDGKQGEFMHFWNEHDYELNTGKDIDALIPEIESLFGAKFPNGYSFLNDGFVARLSANKTLWPIVENLRKSLPIGLLTNMYPHMLDAIGKRGLLPDVPWDAVIDSSVEGMQKPDYRIFELAERRSRARSDEILFIDNYIDNVNAASEFGWKTFLYDPENANESTNRLMRYLSEDACLPPQPLRFS